MTTDARLYEEMCRWYGFDPIAEAELIAEAETVAAEAVQ